MNHKWSTNLIPFGSTSDRFCPAGYRPVMSTQEKILLARQVEGLDGVELHFPAMFEDMSPLETKSFLDQVGLECSIVSPIMASDPAWGYGSLSNPDSGIRQDAAQRIKDAMDASVDLETYRLNVWLGQDGFDYPFQVDHRRNWNYLVEGISECAQHNPKVRLCIEPKLKQPRTHSTLGTVARVLLLVQDIALENVGVLLDTGHSLFAYENLAEQVVSVHDRQKLFYLHFNDNYGDWDWDMVVGSVHYFEFVEMLFWIHQVGYSGWYSLDQFPQREDPVKALSYSIQSVKEMEHLLSVADQDVLLEAVTEHDYIKVREEIARAKKEEESMAG